MVIDEAAGAAGWRNRTGGDERDRLAVLDSFGHCVSNIAVQRLSPPGPAVPLTRCCFVHRPSSCFATPPPRASFIAARTASPPRHPPSHRPPPARWPYPSQRLQIVNQIRFLLRRE